MAFYVFLIKAVILQPPKHDTHGATVANTRPTIVLVPKKKAIAAQHKERKLNYRKALYQATEAIQTEAKKLHEQFDGHGVDYYMMQIMQSSHIQKKTWLVNKWNVYLRQEVKCINDGRLHLMIFGCYILKEF